MDTYEYFPTVTGINSSNSCLYDNLLSDKAVPSNVMFAKNIADVKHAIESNRAQLAQIQLTISALMSSYLSALNNNIKNMGFNSFGLLNKRKDMTYEACTLDAFRPFIVDIVHALFVQDREKSDVGIFKDYECISACDRRVLMNSVAFHRSMQCDSINYMSMPFTTDFYQYDSKVMQTLQNQFVDFVFADKQWKKLLALSIPIPLDDHQLVDIDIISQTQSNQPDLADIIERSNFGKIIVSTGTLEKGITKDLEPVFWSHNIVEVQKKLKEIDKKDLGNEDSGSV